MLHIWISLTESGSKISNRFRNQIIKQYPFFIFEMMENTSGSEPASVKAIIHFRNRKKTKKFTDLHVQITKRVYRR